MSFLESVLGALLSSVMSVTAAPGPGASTPPPPHSAPPPTLSGRPPAPSPTASDVPRVRGGLVVGHDVSWPNCPVGMGVPERRTLGLPMPPRSSRFVVIGLTNGPAFHPNPCLREQVDLARRRDLWSAAYAVVSYPTPDQLAEYGDAGPVAAADLPARLWNTGWAQAKATLASLRAVRFVPPVLWLDVEPVRPPAPWSRDVAANRSVLEGAMAAYGRAGVRLGVYSTQYLWRSVVGEVDYGLPEWRAAGQTSRLAALRLCSRNAIQGGAAVLTQWLEVIDQDVLCPGRPADAVLGEFFTRL